GKPSGRRCYALAAGQLRGRVDPSSRSVQRRPLTARLSQYPLRSESNQSAALPRIDAMHRNKRRANAVENGQAAVVDREISRLIRHSLTLRTVAAPLFQA